MLLQTGTRFTFVLALFSHQSEHLSDSLSTVLFPKMCYLFVAYFEEQRRS